MVTEGIVLGHKISAVGLEVDQVKVYVIETLMPPNTIKGVRSSWNMLDFKEDLPKTSQNFQTIMQTAGEGCQV